MKHCAVGVCSSPVHCAEIGHCFSTQGVVALVANQPAEADPPPCPLCDGSGEITYMTSHLGPDDYEYPGPCEHCGGSGTLADAYAGVVKLLEQKGRDCSRAHGQLWGFAHCRDVVAWRWRVGDGRWSLTDDRQVLMSRPKDAQVECLYPPVKWDEVSREKLLAALNPRSADETAIATRALAIADAAMFTDLKSYGIPDLVRDETPEDCLLFLLDGEGQGAVRTLAEACPELREAVEWLRLRDYVEIGNDADGEHVIVLRRPGEE